MSEFKAELNAETNHSKEVLQTCFKDASSHLYMVFQHARTRFRWTFSIQKHLSADTLNNI